MPKTTPTIPTTPPIQNEQETPSSPFPLNTLDVPFRIALFSSLLLIYPIWLKYVVFNNGLGDVLSLAITGILGVYSLLVMKYVFFRHRSFWSILWSNETDEMGYRKDQEPYKQRQNKNSEEEKLTHRRGQHELY
jgi:hypothetical protein